jgi:hypothetical protein
VLEETRLTRPSASPAYIDTVVTEETLSSPPIVVVAHVVTDARVVVPLAGVVLPALALLGLSRVAPHPGQSPRRGVTGGRRSRTASSSNDPTNQQAVTLTPHDTLIHRP